MQRKPPLPMGGEMGALVGATEGVMKAVKESCARAPKRRAIKTRFGISAALKRWSEASCSAARLYSERIFAFRPSDLKKKTMQCNAKGYKGKVSVPVCPTNNQVVRARCVFWPLLRYSHSATLGQQTRMRVHCGDFASYFLFHRGSGSGLPCGCYIDIPPVRAGLHPGSTPGVRL